MQVLNAVFGIVLARKLDQADYGLVGMLTIFTLIANSLQDSGFVTALTNKRNATHLDYNSVFWFNISVSLLLYLSYSFAHHSLQSSTMSLSSPPSPATISSVSSSPPSALCHVPSSFGKSGSVNWPS